MTVLASHEISLVKGEQQFILRYEVGSEPLAIEVLVQMVNNPELKFDWFDAAVFSHRISQNLSNGDVTSKETDNG